MHNKAAQARLLTLPLRSRASIGLAATFNVRLEILDWPLVAGCCLSLMQPFGSANGRL